MIVPYILGMAIMFVTGAHDVPSPSVTVELETAFVHAGMPIHATIRVAFDAGWHVNVHKPNDEFLVPTELKINPISGIAVKEISYPEPVKVTFEGTGEELETYGPTFSIRVSLDVAGDVKPGDYNVQGMLQYQACDKDRCYPPSSVAVTLPVRIASAAQPDATPGESIPNARPDTAPPANAQSSAAPAPWRSLADSFNVVGEASGYMSASEFITFVDSAESDRGATRDNPFLHKSGWLVALLAITGGLLLNLTPCVLPLIPINVGIIGAGVKSGSRSRGFLLGGAYGAGIALTYGILGLVVILGVSKTFGVINATPWFNAGIAVVFVALALAMFDLYLIDFTRYQARLGVKGGVRGHFVTALLMGAVSALLAGACVAPVIISTIVYAQDRYANGVWLALFLPFLVGVGMALPWPLAGMGLSFLPKPGAWMIRVKQAFGVLILLFAAYYAYLAYDLRQTQKAASGQEMAGWTSSLADGFAVAQREKKPVLIDFWATWCKNCVSMDRTTFRDPRVQARLANYVKIKFQAERPGEPAVREAMDYFDAMGLPTYIILKAK